MILNTERLKDRANYTNSPEMTFKAKVCNFQHNFVTIRIHFTRWLNRKICTSMLLFNAICFHPGDVRFKLNIDKNLIVFVQFAN